MSKLKMKIIPRFHEFADQQTLCRELSQRICAALQEAIEARGTASLVVSGGSTPVPLFAALAEISIEWDRVFITLADERWVEVSDRASNEALVREHLLRGQAKAARVTRPSGLCVQVMSLDFHLSAFSLYPSLAMRLYVSYLSLISFSAF